MERFAHEVSPPGSVAGRAGRQSGTGRRSGIGCRSVDRAIERHSGSGPERHAPGTASRAAGGGLSGPAGNDLYVLDQHARADFRRGIA